MIAEEFTFPVITNNNVVNLTLLPPLWRIASVNHSDHAEWEQENGRKRKNLTSFSGEIVKIYASENDEKAEAEAQEKMDVLWEDFNEELQSSADSSDSDFSEESNYGNNWREEYESLERSSKMREVKLIPATAKRKKLELVAKMVKKLFLLQNRGTIQKRGPN